tara:strand:+ start:6932 stop:7171 length:240 start_codon:yes stop_codon:yes gene_type:complete
MQVSEPGAIASSHGSKALPARHNPTNSHPNSIQVPIEAMEFPSIRQAMPKNDHFSPIPSPVTRKNDIAVSYRVDGISEI